MTTEEQLRWEASARPRAAIAAGLAAVLTLFGGLASGAAYRDLPSNSPNFPVEQAAFLHDHATGLLIAAVLSGLSAVAIALTLNFLYLATKHRKPELPPVARFMALFGGIGLAVGTILRQVIVSVRASDWAAGDRSYAAAKKVVEADPVLATAIVGYAALLALVFALVMLSLNAMRVGLLTRFMGILGVIGAVLAVLPIGTPVPIVQAFWLGALGYLFSGRWPNGVPPAWVTGEAQPWPTQMQLREQREAGADAPPPAPARRGAEHEAEPVGAGTATAERRKRKKRR